MKTSERPITAAHFAPVVAWLVGIGILFGLGFFGGVALWAAWSFPEPDPNAPKDTGLQLVVREEPAEEPDAGPEMVAAAPQRQTGEPAPEGETAAPEPAESGADPGEDAAAEAMAVMAVDSAQKEKLMQVGQQNYATCLACHGPQGEAIVPNMAPNLAGSSVVNGDPETLAKILLKGIQPEGRYAGAMVGWEAAMGDEQIAGVLTYIRNSFGNTAPAIPSDYIAEMRAELSGRGSPYTRDELDIAGN